MSYLSRKELSIVPDLSSDYKRAPLPSDHVTMARVEIDIDGCNGCELCVEVCPANALVMAGPTEPVMVGDNAACIACGDCVAICLPDIIRITRFQQYEGRYRFIGRGEPRQPEAF